MRKILFPTDYSDTSYNAYKYALELADKEGAKLYVLHIYEPPIISGGILPHQIINLNDRIKALETNKINEEIPVLRKIRTELRKEKVDVFFKVESGYLLPKIKSFIKRYDIDYIVMGTEGDNLSRKRFLGKNTLNIIENVQVPVLSIPKEATFKKIRNVVFLVSLVEDEEIILDALVKEARHVGFAIKCVHLGSTNTDNRKLRDRWKKGYPDIDLSFHVFSSDYTDVKALLTYLKVQDIDLISMTHRPRYFFEKLISHSLTVNLAHQIGVPFLVFRKS